MEKYIIGSVFCRHLRLLMFDIIYVQSALIVSAPSVSFVHQTVKCIKRSSRLVTGAPGSPNDSKGTPSVE